MNEYLQKIAAELGLATADLAPEQIVDAVKRCTARAMSLASIHSLLGLEVDAEPKRAELAILDLQKPSDRVARTDHDQVVAERDAARVELSVQRAIQAGAISATKEDQDHWRKRARVDLDDCDRRIASCAGQVVPMGEQRPRDSATAKTSASGLTPQQERVCAQLGITAEQFKAAKIPRQIAPGEDESEG